MTSKDTTNSSISSSSLLTFSKEFPLLDLPILVLEKILSFITDPLDLKALRICCKATCDIVNRNPALLTHLKVTPKDLKDLENLVKNEGQVKWNNFRFPPELYYIGCRRQHTTTFNKLFADFTNAFACQIETLEMDRFDLRNDCHVNLLRKCQKLLSFKVDAAMIKGASKEQLEEILEDVSIKTVLARLEFLDVIAFEFLDHPYQFEFMGKLLEKCTNLSHVGSWGYFPEWEQPSGGTIHFKYFIWPLLSYLRKKIKIVDLMLGDSVQTSDDLAQCGFQFINDTMDWQAGKWIVDLGKENESDDFSGGIEKFLYSRIKLYAHRAVGWFDEAEFRKCALTLMKNLSSIHIHSVRDINLSGENPFAAAKPLFTKLESLTLIVGNRLTLAEQLVEDSIPLEKALVDMLLNTRRPSVKYLKLDMDLDHQDEFGSLSLPLVLHNFPNLTSFCVEEWGPSDKQLLAIYQAFPALQVLMFCGRNVTDVGIIGNDEEGEEGNKSMEVDDGGKRGILKLRHLQILKIFSIRLPPKNIFPWPTQENNRITDLSFQKGFSFLSLRKFHFLLKSNLITLVGINTLLQGQYAKTGLEFLLNWLPCGVDSAKSFEQIDKTFKFLDPQTFLEPANFVIPDIGQWVL